MIIAIIVSTLVGFLFGVIYSAIVMTKKVAQTYKKKIDLSKFTPGGIQTSP